MKVNITFVFCVILCILVYLIAPTTALSQQMEDVVYLKDGSIIRGFIIEQVPGVHVKIQTRDGNIFVYKMEQIDRIMKEPFLIKKGGGKSPGLALGLSLGGGCLTSFLIPIDGIGQFYNGDIGKGFFFSAWSVASWLLIIAGFEDNVTTWYGVDIDVDNDDSLIFVGLLCRLGGYTASAVDAYRSAKRKNEERGFGKLPNDNFQERSKFNIVLGKDRGMFLSFQHTF